MNFFRLRRSIISLLKNPNKIFNLKSYYGVYKNLFNPSKPYKHFKFKKKFEILNQTFEITKRISNHKKVKLTNIKNLYYLKKDKKLNYLHDLFKKNGTDKNNHEYDLIYIYLFKKFNFKFKKILEIGIGSNNTKIDGNMGYQATPGASLLAFNEFFEKAIIYGADIDPSIRLNKKNIKIFVADQTSRESLSLLSKKINNLNLIIDDGLHLPHANLLTFEILSNKLAKNGIYVIEDIDIEFLNIYLTFSKLIISSYKIEIFKTKKRLLFVAIKL